MAVVLWLALPVPGSEPEAEPDFEALRWLDLEQLMAIRIPPDLRDDGGRYRVESAGASAAPRRSGELDAAVEEDLMEISLASIVYPVVRLALAGLIALPIAWNRELSSDRSLGLRTFPLVAMASCGYLLVGQSIAGGDAQVRVLQGLVTGIGFLGGGAIVKKGLEVHGTATAASIWSTAAIGAAVAYTRYEIAVALSLATLGALWGLKPVKEKVEEIEEGS